MLALYRHGPLALAGLLLLLGWGCWTESRFAQGLVQRRGSRWSGVVWRQTTRVLLLELLDIGRLLLELRHHLLLRRVHHPHSTSTTHWLKLMEMVLRRHGTTLLLNLLLLDWSSHSSHSTHTNSLLLRKCRHVPLGRCLWSRRLCAHRCRCTRTSGSIVGSRRGQAVAPRSSPRSGLANSLHAGHSPS